MNVSLRRAYVLLVALLLYAAPAWAVRDTLHTFINQEVEWEFVSMPNDPNSVTLPAHGTLVIAENVSTNNNFDYILSYTPYENFLGMDYFTITRWVTFGSFSYQERIQFTVYVKMAGIEARHDFVTTMVDEAVTITVTDNDYSSNGVMQIAAAPMANNGRVVVLDDDRVRFIPDPGYSGLAHFNYTLCNGEGVCSSGTVSVSVLTPDMPKVEQFKIFTKKNQRQDVLVPDAFSLTGGPNHGSYDDSGAVPQYYPDQDFTGTDQLKFTYNGHQIMIDVVVLDLVENTFAYDDEVYTTSYQSVEFNVLKNDAYGYGANSVNIRQPLYGRIEVTGEGEAVYYPPAGFEGVDELTYTSNSPGGQTETAKVYIYVSNFEPVYTKFKMLTPKRTPLIIGYNVPIDGFEFEITEQGELGTAVFLPGDVQTVIYDTEITGYNLIVYIPDEEVEEGMDEFEVAYCVKDADGSCTYNKSVKVEMEILNVGQGEGPMCFYDCVWPGDTNYDGIVNMEDLLPLGLEMGEVGKSRPDVTFEHWYGQYAPDWTDLFNDNPLNTKHIDADGDAIVTAADTIAIRKFYGRTHSIAPTYIPFYDFVIRLQGNLFAEPGDLVELDLYIGTPNQPAEDVYGFTFPFPYNPETFDPESMRIDFDNTSWLSYNSPILSMSHHDKEGLLEAGYTRTSGISAAGFGKIGTVSFVVIDDLAGFRPDTDGIIQSVRLGGGVSKAINSAGKSFGVRIEEVDLQIKAPEKEADEKPIEAQQLKVAPNPVNDRLRIHLNGSTDFERVVIFNLMGQQVYDSGATRTNRSVIDVSQWADGLYVLKVFTPRGALQKKFEVLHP